MHKLLIGFFIIALGLNPVIANACSCAQVTEQQRYMDASDVVLGTVVATKLLANNEGLGDPARPIGHTSARVENTIRIAKTIKGKATQQMILIDGVADGANCAVGLITGREYLIYLYDNNVLSICSDTRLYNEFCAHALIKELASYQKKRQP